MALAAPRPAAAQAMRRQPAAAQRAVARHGLGGLGRARGFGAAGADEEIGERELVETDHAAQGQRHHAARKLAICGGRRKPCVTGHGVATVRAFSLFRASTSSR